MESITVNKSDETVKVWLVQGRSGQWEDWYCWIVAAFFHEDQANSYKEALKKAVDTLDTEAEWEDQLKHMHLDPDFCYDDNIHYRVISTPLKIWT